MYTYMYVYIYIYRERDRYIDIHISMCFMYYMYICIYVHIYIYIYIRIYICMYNSVYNLQSLSTIRSLKLLCPAHALARGARRPGSSESKSSGIPCTSRDLTPRTSDERSVRSQRSWILPRRRAVLEGTATRCWAQRARNTWNQRNRETNARPSRGPRVERTELRGRRAPERSVSDLHRFRRSVVFWNTSK